MTDSVQEFHIDQMIDMIRKRLNNIEYSHSLFDTRTLCRCIFSSILSLIESGCLLIRNKEITGYSIIARSIVEYIVDYRLLAARNDSKSNIRFANYYILLRYWERERFESTKRDLERIMTDYNEYISKHLAEDIREYKNRSKGYNASDLSDEKILTSMEEVDRYLRSRYRKSWSGMPFPERLQEVNLSFTDAEKNMFGSIMDSYNVYMSQFTHPTPYSAIPHFNLKNGTFENDYDKVRHKIELPQKFLLFSLLIATRTLTLVHNQAEKRVLGRLFIDLFQQFPELQKLAKLDKLTSDGYPQK